MYGRLPTIYCITIEEIVRHLWFGDTDAIAYEREPVFKDLAEMVITYNEKLTEDVIRLGFEKRVFDRSMVIPRLLALHVQIRSP